MAPISDVVMGCHLAPNFLTLPSTTQLPTTIDSLSLACQFFFNPYYNYFVFKLCEQWRQARPEQYRLTVRQATIPYTAFDTWANITYDHHLLDTLAQTVVVSSSGIIQQPVQPQLSSWSQRYARPSLGNQTITDKSQSQNRPNFPLTTPNSQLSTPDTRF
ncbi:hypothetical protein FRC12_014956 [Ceratobasidium sp. 428]|nr:hypothetical protein FRC12_014956 [Ceratobasidium sp. 428]